MKCTIWSKKCKNDTFLSKKTTKCLLDSPESYNFAPEIKKRKEKMLNLNLISAIIIIRLQGAAGSDLGVYI